MKIIETHELIKAISQDIRKDFKNEKLTDLEIYNLALNIYKVNLIDKLNERLFNIEKILEVIQITKD
jgi:hypothetical protein